MKVSKIPSYYFWNTAKFRSNFLDQALFTEKKQKNNNNNNNKKSRYE